MSSNNKFSDVIKALFSFSKSERRGILYLLPLLMVVSLMVVLINRSEGDNDLIYNMDDADSVPRAKAVADFTAQEDSVRYQLFEFDPNNVTYRELLRLGMSKRAAAGFIKYRTAGKVFGVKEEFAACYGVSEQMYDRLEPYIIIGEKYLTQPRGNGAQGVAPQQLSQNSGHDSLFEFDPNILDANGYSALGFSVRQAQALIKYREMIGGFRSEQEFEKCYMVSPERMSQLRPYMKFAEHERDVPEPSAVELNAADSATLRSVRGIGEVTVRAIMEYRARLGGFVSINQLSDINSVTERNFELIAKQIWVDSCIIQKIDINFASPKQLNERLANHPYCGSVALRKLLKQRQLKGGWSSIGDMIEQKIVTPRQAEKLAPYLLFNAEQHQD